MNLLVKPLILEAVPAATLDELWHEAEQLGAVEVDQGWSREPKYRVTINFKRESGTRISAVGRGDHIAVAMAVAINEAREMGAGAKS